MNTVRQIEALNKRELEDATYAIYLSIVHVFLLTINSP